MKAIVIICLLALSTYAVQKTELRTRLLMRPGGGDNGDSDGNKGRGGLKEFDCDEAKNKLNELIADGKLDPEDLPADVDELTCEDLEDFKPPKADGEEGEGKPAPANGEFMQLSKSSDDNTYTNTVRNDDSEGKKPSVTIGSGPEDGTESEAEGEGGKTKSGPHENEEGKKKSETNESNEQGGKPQGSNTFVQLNADRRPREENEAGEEGNPCKELFKEV